LPELRERSSVRAFKSLGLAPLRKGGTTWSAAAEEQIARHVCIGGGQAPV
jgi:hypothetical protein